MMYNDQIMQFLCLMAVYSISCINSCILAALFFTFAISMKASALFYIPAFLGTVQYRFGIKWLIFSIIVIISWQIFVALPFVMTSDFYNPNTKWISLR